jgi:hypothetical protein
VRALVALLAVPLALVPAVHAGTSSRTVSADGVQLRIPDGWRRVQTASDGPVVDPKTVLVVGSRGARPRPSRCQIAAYRVPPSGAVVVVVRWRTPTSGGARSPRSREPLRNVVLDDGGFECWPAHRAGVAQLTLGGHAYQVNVLVGDRAPSPVVRDALGVVRSFDLAP